MVYMLQKMNNVNNQRGEVSLHRAGKKFAKNFSDKRKKIAPPRNENPRVTIERAITNFEVLVSDTRIWRVLGFNGVATTFNSPEETIARFALLLYVFSWSSIGTTKTLKAIQSREYNDFFRKYLSAGMSVNDFVKYIQKYEKNPTQKNPVIDYSNIVSKLIFEKHNLKTYEDAMNSSFDLIVPVMEEIVKKQKNFAECTDELNKVIYYLLRFCRNEKVPLTHELIAEILDDIAQGVPIYHDSPTYDDAPAELIPDKGVEARHSPHNDGHTYDVVDRMKEEEADHALSGLMGIKGKLSDTPSIIHIKNSDLADFVIVEPHEMECTLPQYEKYADFTDLAGSLKLVGDINQLLYGSAFRNLMEEADSNNLCYVDEYLRNVKNKLDAFLNINPQTLVTYGSYESTYYNYLALTHLMKEQKETAQKNFIRSMVYECLWRVGQIDTNNYRDMIRWTKKYSSGLLNFNRLAKKTIEDPFKEITFMDLSSLILNYLSFLSRQDVLSSAAVGIYGSFSAHMLWIAESCGEVSDEFMTEDKGKAFKAFVDGTIDYTTMTPSQWEIKLPYLNYLLKEINGVKSLEDIIERIEKKYVRNE